MTIPAASPTSAAYRDALLALQKQQRAQLQTLIQQTEAALHEDWLRGPGIVSQYYAPLIDQYARALNDLRALHGDPAARLSLDWLAGQDQSLRQIEANVRYTLDKYATEGVDAVTAAQRAAANAGLTDASALTQEALSPAWETGVNPAMLFNRPNPDAIAAWVGRAGNGHPLGDLFANFSSEATGAARQAMLFGLATGANPLQMVSGIQQAMGISRSRAITIARTEVLGSYRAAAHETYRQNSDVLGYWLWSAGGNNPCAMCMGMDGTLHGLDESLDDHPCGKCAPLPVTKPWSDILGPLGIDASDLEETSIGAPGAYETGEEKFARMSPERQREIIGTQTGYEAYQRGEVSLKDFIGVRPPSDGFPSSYYQRSLKELQIPTRQGHLVEPSQLIAGPHRAIQRGAVTPDELMPAWAKQSAASRNVYQILRNGLPYDMMSHEQGLLITNLEQMLREDIPVNVRAAVERQLQALGQSVERATSGQAARNAVAAAQEVARETTITVERAAEEHVTSLLTGDELRTEAQELAAIIQPKAIFRMSNEEFEASQAAHLEAKAALLRDNPEWQRFVNDPDILVHVSDLPDPIFTPEMRAVARIEEAWHTTPVDSDPMNVALRRMANEVFGLNVPMRTVAPNVLKGAEQLTREYGDVLRAYVQTTYEQTQRWFEEHSIAEITLYRGASADVAKAGLLYNGEAIQSVIRGSALASYTTDAEHALTFAQSRMADDGYNALMAVRVPVSEVFGTPFTSMASRQESEFILFGNARDAAILSWKGADAPSVGKALDELATQLPVNVRAAVERQLQALGQSVERQTAGAAARDVAEREIGRAFAPARATISEEEAAARAEVKTARSKVNSLNRKLNKALEAGKSTEQLEKDIQAARATLEKAQGRLDTQVAIRKAQEAAAKQAAKEAKAAERLAAREAAKAQKAAEREAAKAAKRAEKQAAKEATTQAAREAEQEIEHAAITDTGNFSTDLGTAEDIQKAAESNSFFGDAKHQYYEWKPIVSRLGARLADNPDVQALADRIKEIAKAEGSRFTASPRNAVDFILSQYHTTFAYEENPFVIELQKAVQEEFGTAGRAYGNFSARSIAQADKLLGDVRPGLRAIVREMYNDTQQYFEEQGITEVNLYRGMSFSTKTKPEGLLFNGAAQQAQMELHAMSSFSVNPTEAASYAEGVGKDRYVVVAGTKVPVERILSIPQTGFGSFRDHEVLVLGGTDNYVVIPKVVGANAVETVPYTPEELYAKFGVAQTLATSEANDAAFAASRAMQGPFSAGASYDLSAADKAFVENVRQQISALDQAGMSHEEVRAIGQQINDRIMSDPVIADLHDAAVAVQTIRSSEFSQLTEDQLAWVRGDASAVEAHGGVKFNDAYVRYQAEYQARVKTYLQEVREMGGADVRLAEDADAVGSQAIRDMQDVMPRDWIEASNDLGDVQIVKNGARNSAGWYEASQDGGGKIGLSYNRATPADDLALRSNALHEMMHRMENAIPRIGDLERDFYNSRTLGEEYVRLTNGIAQRTKLDEWIDEYLGREPIVSLRPEYTTALGNVARTSASYELLSMGAEMLLGGGGTYDLVALREDQEFVHFILGLLSIVRAEGAGAVLP